MIDVTPKLIKAGVSKANISRFVPYLNSMMDKAGINTEKRINAFLAQALHESGNLKHTKELANYKAETVMELWPAKFKGWTLPQVQALVKDPVALFNKIYGGRMGNKAYTDGYRYLGRGIFGNTGKEQYEKLKRKSGIDFVSKPELLEEPKYAVMAAIDYWNDKKLNSYADKGDFQAISKAVNTGSAKSKTAVIGKEDRDLKYSILSGIKQVAGAGIGKIKENPYMSIVILIILLCIFAYAVTQL